MSPRPLRHQLIRDGLLVVGLTGLLLSVAGWFGARAIMVGQAKARAQAGLREAERRLVESLSEARRTGEALADLGRQGLFPPMGTLVGERALLTELRSRPSLSNLTFVLADGRASAANAPESDRPDRWITRGTTLGPQGPERRLRLWTPEGRLDSEGPDPAAPPDWNQRPWVVETRVRKGPLWIGPYPFLGRVGFGMTYALPVSDPAHPGGVLGVDLVLGDLLSWLREARPTPRTRLAIADEQARLLIPPDQEQPSEASRRALVPEVLTPASHPVPAAVHALPLSDGTGAWTRLTVDGAAYFAQRRTLAIPDGPTWELLAAIPEGDLLDEPRRVALGTFLVSLLAISILGWRLALDSRRVAEPLERLALEAEGLAEGRDLTSPETPIEEIRKLGQALRMASLALQERAQLEGHLRQAQRRELVGTMAAGVAHDLGNLLSAVSANLDLAEEPDLGPEGRARALSQAGLALRRSQTFLRALLAVGRQEPAQPERIPMDLALALKTSLETLGPLLGAQVKVALEVSEGPLQVVADPLQVEQLILNLALNGRDAMGRGGLLTLSAGRGPSGQPFLAVRDEGQGIPEAILDRLFIPFFTTKEAGRGSGLGLAMVQSIAQGHGAEVTVTSVEGKGSTFTITFPIPEPLA